MLTKCPKRKCCNSYGLSWYACICSPSICHGSRSVDTWIAALGRTRSANASSTCISRRIRSGNSGTGISCTSCRIVIVASCRNGSRNTENLKAEWNNRGDILWTMCEQGTIYSLFFRSWKLNVDRRPLDDSSTIRWKTTQHNGIECFFFFFTNILWFEWYISMHVHKTYVQDVALINRRDICNCNNLTKKEMMLSEELIGVKKKLWSFYFIVYFSFIILLK